MLLNRERLPDAICAHINNLSCIAINTPGAASSLAILVAFCVLCAKLCEDLDGTVSRVLNDGAGDDLHRLCDRLVRPLCNTLDKLCSPFQPNSDSHLSGTTSWAQLRVPDDVPGDAHGIVQVALNLVQNVLGRAAEQDGAGLGVLALCEVGEVLVTKLGNLEQTALRTDVGRLCGEDGVDDGGTGGSCDTVVVCLADTANGCDISLDKEVLGEVCGLLAKDIRNWAKSTYR